MPWNPNTYDQFKQKRQEPFYDLFSHIHPASGMHVLDLGCGTGELTGIVADKLPEAQVLGIDKSAEMLAKALNRYKLSFLQRSIEEQLQLTAKWDLILANASLQWVEDHPVLFPRIFSRLLPGGQLAVQMPSQNENRLNQLLEALVQESPYYEVLHTVIRRSPVLTLDEYTQLLFANGAKDVIVYQKVYPIIASTTDSFFEFIAGTSLIPYMEKLEEPMRATFTAVFKKRIADSFTGSPLVYPFKRILLVARC